jgi:hypothetical protein
MEQALVAIDEASNSDLRANRLADGDPRTIQRCKPAPKIFLDYIGQTILAHATYVYGRTLASLNLMRGHLALGRPDARKSF